MVKATIRAGVCGFTTVVNAQSEDSQNVSFEIESDCETIRRLAADLPVVDAYSEIGSGDEGAVMRTAHSILKGCCAGCVVPPAIFKGMQVAACVALPKDIHLTMQKE